MIIIGPDEQLIITHIHRIFDAFLARLDQYLFASGVVRANQTHFAGFVVARSNNQPIILRRQAGPNREALIGLGVQRHILINWGADHMQFCLERPPILGRRAVDQSCIVRDPDEAAAQIGNLVCKQFASLQILDLAGVTL